MKRSPYTDALDTLGSIHEYDEPRDAIHLAVVQVKPGIKQALKPGDHIVIKSDGYAYKTNPGYGDGIVDPFLTNLVFHDDKFWMILYPGSVKSLRHVWEHHDLDNRLSKKSNSVDQISSSEHEKYLKLIKDFCKENNWSESGFKSMMENLSNGIYHSSDPIMDISLEENHSILIDYADYWTADFYSYSNNSLIITINGVDCHRKLDEEILEAASLVYGLEFPFRIKDVSLSCTC